MDILILLIIGLFFILEISSIFPASSLLAARDATRHYANGYSLIRGPQYYRMTEYFWLHLFLASFYSLSNAPVAVGQTILVTLNFIPILAFYIMSKQFLGRLDKRYPIISTTVWSMFSSLAWIYAAYLKLSGGMGQPEIISIAADKTWLGTIYPMGFWVQGFNPIYVSFAMFFVLLYLVSRTDLGNVLRSVLIITILGAMYFTHPPEAIFFIILVSLYAFTKSGYEVKVKEVLTAVLASLIMVTIIHLILSYLLTMLSWLSIQIILALAVMVGVSYIASNFLRINFSEKRVEKLALPFTLGLLFFYLLSLGVWFMSTDEWSHSYVSSTGLVPWFFYPLWLGISGILAIIGLNCFMREKKRYVEIELFIFLVVSAILAGRTISVLRIDLGFPIPYRENRFIVFIGIACAVFASLGLIKIEEMYQVQNLRKKLIICSLLGLIFLTGISSTLICLESWNYGAEYGLSPNKEELKALNFLRETLDINPNSMVSCLTERSDKALVFSTASIHPLQSKSIGYNPTYVNYLLSKSPKEWTTIPYSQIHNSYLYLHKSDIEYLQDTFGETYFFQSFLPMLPKVFENSESSIYKIPYISAPLLDAEIALVVPFDKIAQFKDYIYAFNILGLESYNYTVLYDLDDKVLNKKCLVLSFDPIAHYKKDGISVYDKNENYNNGIFQEETREFKYNCQEAHYYLDYVKSGGEIIVLNTNGYGSFFDFFQANVTDYMLSSKIVGNGNLSIYEVEVPIIQTDSSIEILSYYVSLDETEYSPLSFFKNIEKGRIIYFNIYPIISKICNYNGQNSYNLLKGIFNLSNINLKKENQKIKDVKGRWGIQAIFKNAILNGKLKIYTNFIFLPNFHSKKISLSNQDGISEFVNISSLSLSNYTEAYISLEKAEIINGDGLYCKINVIGKVRIKFVGKKVNIKIKYNNINKIINSTSPTVSFNTTKKILTIMRTPHITVSGKLSLIDEKRLPYFFNIESQGEAVNIQGFSEFTLFYSDTYNLAGNFSYDGVLELVQKVKWNEYLVTPKLLFWICILIPPFVGIYVLVHMSERGRVRIKLHIRHRARETMENDF